MKMKSFLMIALIATATLFVACGKKDAKAKEAAKTEAAKAAKAANLAADVQAFVNACNNLDADAVITTCKKVNAYPEDVLNNMPEELVQASENAVNYFYENATPEDRQKVDAALQ